MVLCIRPSLAIGIHRGTLAYIRWGIRLECARGGGGGGGEAGGGRQSCMTLLVYKHWRECWLVAEYTEQMFFIKSIYILLTGKSGLHL